MVAHLLAQLRLGSYIQRRLPKEWMSECRYCEGIREHDGTYSVRPARHTVDSYPRCDLHWRYDCAVCGDAHHFDGTAFCPREERFFCRSCASEYRAPRTDFWGWTYYYRLYCPWCGEWHAALDYTEYLGDHPWDVHAEWRRERRGMTAEEEISVAWDLRVGPADELTDEDLVRGWDAVAEWWTSLSNPRGDLNREWVIDPVLFEYLGDVQGLRILDAGCGMGYLARLLARKGAVVVGVDFSPKLLAMAKEEEASDPLGIAYHRADLADLAFLGDQTFDAVVSNVVLQDIRGYGEAIAEIYRVLRPRGRFVFSLTHPAFDRPPARWLQEPEDSDRVEKRKLLMGRYFERMAIYWSPRGKPAVLGYHRPLRDYFEALYDAGFVVLRLEEPLPSEEALDRHYREMADFFQAPNFIVVEAQQPG